MIPDSAPPDAFEIEAGTMASFLDLLRRREEERVPSEPETLPRRAVFVAPLRHARTTEEGIPTVTRRVQAAFAYGRDLVTLTYVTADGYEMSPPAEDEERNSGRQEERLQKTKARIEEGLTELGLALPVLTAWMKLPGASPTPGPGGGKRGAST